MEKAMEGLLRKATKIRKSLSLALGPELVTGSRVDGKAAIDKEDQQDIIRQIEEAVSQNKIRVGPELFAFKARNKGFFLPLFVNIGALVLIVAGIAVMSLTFNQRQSARAASSAELKSAEGVLLQELRKESEADIAKKDEEIAAIQGQLGSIAKQRDSLASDMQAKIDLRTAELKKQMDAELQQERARLQAQGLSKADIDARIAALEKQKNDELNQALAAYTKQVSDERARSDAQLKASQDQFTQNLARANQDKDKLAADAQAREQDLRKQLSAQSTQSQAQLSSAQAEIQKLAQSRDATDSANTQIAGFYSKIRDQIRQENWDQALKTLDLLKAFLNSDQIIALDALRARRDSELFIVDSLSKLVSSDKAAANPATTSTGPLSPAIAQTVQSVQDIQDLYAKALAAQAGGNQGLALQYYNSALTRIPAIGQAFTYVRDKTVEDSQNLATQASQKALDAATASLKASSDAYEARIAQLQSQNASLVSDYEAKLAARDKAIADLNGQSDTGLAAKDTEISRLNAQSEDLKKQIDAANQTIADLKKAAADSQTQAASNAAASGNAQSDRVSQLQAQIAALNTVSGSKDAQLAKDKDDLARLGAIADTYNAIATSYANYLSASNQNTTIQGKLALDSFIADPSVARLLPGFLDRIKLYDQAFEDAGRKDVTQSLADFVYTVSSYSDSADRKKLLNDQISKTSDAATKELYQNLLSLIP